MLLYDCAIIGAGAADLMAASTAGLRGRKVLLLESSTKIAEKIRISGGGRCNFTNLNISANNYISNNPNFIKSAFAQYSNFDFIKLVEKYKITYFEKTLGQLFCHGSSKQIIDMMLAECISGNVEIHSGCNISKIEKSDNFILQTNIGVFAAKKLVIATGGLSIPKLGATSFGYEIARQFGLNIIKTTPALVPLTLEENDLKLYSNLSGVSILSNCSYGKVKFNENILFTHRGLSGPAILQISSYLDLNSEIIVDFCPSIDILKSFHNPKINLGNALKENFPNKFVELFLLKEKIEQDKKIVSYKKSELLYLANLLHSYKFKP